MTRYVCAAFVAACLALLAFAAPAVSAPAKVTTGVSYISENDPTTFARVKQAGATFVHGWVRWNHIAPAVEPDSWDPRDPDDPNYNWEQIDTWVVNAVGAGLTPLLQIYYAPQWANRCVTPEKYAVTGAPCDPDPDKMADFAYAVAKRYDGTHAGLPRISYWQPQNEPNLAMFFYPQRRNGRIVSPELYRELLNKFYDAVKSVSRSNKVLSAGLAPNANTSTIAPLAWARQLFCMKGREKPKPTNVSSAKCRVKLDIFDMHPYTSGGPTHVASGKDNIQLAQLPKLKTLLAAADRAGRIQGDSARTPLWVTEMAWDSRPPDPNGVPFKILKRWTSESVYRAWQAGVDNFFWYTLRDQDPKGRPWSETTQAGLFFRGATVEADRVKPNFQAFRFPFVAFTKDRSKKVKGAEIWGRTPPSKPGAVLIERRQGARWVKLARVKANANGLFKGFIRIRKGSNKAGFLRATYRGETSVPFSLRPVKDRFVRPFG